VAVFFNIGFARQKTNMCSECEANGIKLMLLTVGRAEYEDSMYYYKITLPLHTTNSAAC